MDGAAPAVVLRRTGEDPERCASATIGGADASFACMALELGSWSVLGSEGMRLLFPSVGWLQTRPARLRLLSGVWDLPGGNAGQVAAAGWHLDEVGEDARSAWVRAHLDAGGVAGAAYPFQVHLQATWRLDDEGLRLAVTLANRGRVHAPFGCGIRAHLAGVGERVAALGPAEQVWVRAPDGQPTGALEPVSGPTDLRRPRPLEPGAILDVFLTRRQFGNGQTQAAVLDSATGREVWLTTSADFRDLLLRLDARGAGYLESATCAPDAFALQAQGTLAGVRALAPNETWRGGALLVCRPGARPESQRWYQAVAAAARAHPSSG